ncbi:MAG: DUF2911 domain-containing protein [Nitritalea sp.]
MKKTRITLLTLSVLAVFGLYSCGGADSGSQEAESEEMEMELPAKNERASPLRTLEGSLDSGKQLFVQYGAPSVKGRTVWGELVPYDNVWRTGANEATYIEFTETLTVGDKEVAPGKYSLFTIPKENGDWTVILNEEWDLAHGHFEYDEKFDVIRTVATPEFVEESQEQLSISIETPGIVVRWEKLKLPIVIR